MFKTNLAALLLFSSLTVVVTDRGKITEFNIPERPEGITAGRGSTLYVSQILSGKVLAIDALTGDTTEVIGEQTNREAWGLWYQEDDSGQGYLWVAGGGPSYGNGVPEIYLYNLASGESVVACSPLSVNETGYGAFVNDVTVLEGTAYVTNSFSDRIMTVNVSEAMTGKCNVGEIILDEEFVPLDVNDWGANGIVPFVMGGFNGLLIANEIDGTVFSLQLTPEGVPSHQKVLGQSEVLGADGLNILDDQLYVTQNYENKVAVFKLTADDSGTISVDRLGELESDMYVTPATSALYDGYVYSANSRFIELPDIATEADNNVVGVLNTFCCGNEDDRDATEAPSDAPSDESSDAGRSSINLDMTAALAGGMAFLLLMPIV